MHSTTFHSRLIPPWHLRQLPKSLSRNFEANGAAAAFWSFGAAAKGLELTRSRGSERLERKCLIFYIGAIHQIVKEVTLKMHSTTFQYKLIPPWHLLQLPIGISRSFEANGAAAALWFFPAVGKELGLACHKAGKPRAQMPNF